ncbi:enoyl-CoA hydratase/isomerase family protein [Bacillus sp. EB106-08-02-XG196]|uniref:enoyl-CoA hydratase-related protein n=1 Tax=Bacillus sp. EB106-08-02-XG196 TaxID=2737049 RepID=UPI0015C4A77D|nr:enoyl-CoA hydratase-related protein [Bacillus sp. EB106-08-02-XG196]NWQ43429.1 enoyl-CoA hydratase/isomerase family protein [Bacillus sp. EB106-08-02-XG196]
MTVGVGKKFSNVKLKVENNIAFIFVDNPPANALNSHTINGLKECIHFINQEDSRIKVVIISGEGKFFIAGADIKEFVPAIGNSQTGEEMAKRAQALFSEIEKMEIPIIAAINGACLGGGLELAMACHMRIAADDALLGQPEVNLGLIPGFGGTQRLPRLTNKAKAIELILTGDFIKGPEAERIGLVNRSCPSEFLMDEAIKLANKIANERSAKSVAAALYAVTKGTKVELEEGLDLEAGLFGKLFNTDDMKEGVTAFVEKRKPNFIDK